MALQPVGNFDEAAERFPGLEQSDPRALGHFAFYSAAHFPEELYEGSPFYDEDWHRTVIDVIRDVAEWRRSAARSGSTESRFELAQGTQQRYEFAQDTEAVQAQLTDGDAAQGFDASVAYLRRWGFSFVTDYEKSPLFPKGRSVQSSIERHIDEAEKKFDFPYHGGRIARQDREEFIELDPAISDYLQFGHRKKALLEQLQGLKDLIEPVDQEQLRMLRERYGAKAANLMAMQQALESFYAKINEEHPRQTVTIPAFEAVGVETYEQWRNNHVEWQRTVQELQTKAVELAAQAPGGLVAIRSSAVYSEDGEEHTGAGIYASTVVDPSDAQAFAEAVRLVYESVDSPDAIAYRQAIGVEQEQMGLLLQPYIEVTRDGLSSRYTTFGFINSAGANRNLIEAHTPEGVLLYDKQKMVDGLMIDNYHRPAEAMLHAMPDHTYEIRNFKDVTLNAAHAAVFGEIVFGRPVQVEFVFGSVVQVRPLPSKAYETADVDIEFPEDIPELASSKAIGVGDRTLELLSNDEKNEGREGVVVFNSEYGFTDWIHRTHQGLAAVPQSGAVIILRSSDAGHIQTLCQEKGLLCLYADEDSDNFEALGDMLFDRRRAGDNTPMKLRIVANGYEGRVYLEDQPEDEGYES